MPSKLPLPRLAKNNTRMIARQAWIETDCQFDESMQLVENRIGQAVGTMHIRKAKALAGELLRHWRSVGNVEPEAVFVAGEPGCSEF